MGIYSQFAPAIWHKKISEATLADAIIDRIVHDSYTIEIQYADTNQDKSMREIYGLEAQKEELIPDWFRLRNHWNLLSGLVGTNLQTGGLFNRHIQLYGIYSNYEGINIQCLNFNQ